MSNTETKKTETPKTETTNPTNPFPTFDPMAMWTQSQLAFQKMMTESLGRAQAFGEQYAALENQAIIRAQGAIATWAQLAQDTLAYTAQLTAEARKLGLEAARRMAA